MVSYDTWRTAAPGDAYPSDYDEWYHESDLPNFDSIRSDLEKAYQAAFITGDVDALLDAIVDIGCLFDVHPDYLANDPMITTLNLPAVVNG